VPPNEQLRRRHQVVRLHLAGLTRMGICAATGLSYSAVRKILLQYAKEGPKSISLGQRGRRHGDKRLITSAQEHAARRLIGTRRHWDALTWRTWLAQHWQVHVSERTMRRYLAKWRDPAATNSHSEGGDSQT
jgi:transposase